MNEFRRLLEETARDALQEGEALIDEAVKRAEARRRFHVDSQGSTVITYVGPEDLEEDE